MSALNPYDLRLHEVLFGEDERRKCQLVTLPSFEPESAVYILVRGKDAPTPLVVSRKLDAQLYGLMMSMIERQAGAGKPGTSYSIGPAAQYAALAKIRGSSHTESAEIDAATVEVLDRACEAVLRRAHSQVRSTGVDGVGYHAGHWRRREFLTGRARSPATGTIANDYITLGETLHAYAASAPDARAAVKRDLIAKAERLIARAGAKR